MYKFLFSDHCCKFWW